MGTLLDGWESTWLSVLVKSLISFTYVKFQTKRSLIYLWKNVLLYVCSLCCPHWTYNFCALFKTFWLLKIFEHYSLWTMTFCQYSDWNGLIFLRNEKNQLLLGIRRANRPQTVMPSSVLSSDSMHLGLLAAAAHAAATNSRFTIFYNPRFLFIYLLFFNVKFWNF